MPTSFKLKKKPEPAQQTFDRYRKKAKRDIAKLGTVAQRKHRKVVSNWSNKNKPTFPKQVIDDGVSVKVIVYAKKRGKRQVHLWLDETGTKPHKIRARRKPVLRFQAGRYQPKTWPVGRYGGPGTVLNGRWVSKREVRHPGFKPRKFSETIRKEMQPLERETFEALTIG